MNSPQNLARLVQFVRSARRLVIISGAGCSTESGIPDYRDEQGEWKHPPPVQFGDFRRSAAVRRRYWARALVGWRRIAAAQPNAAHRALAGLERTGGIARVITQNVDGLHQRAGSRRVIDLHGRLDRVECLRCRNSFPREEFQRRLHAANPGWNSVEAGAAPDGDAKLEADTSAFRVPDCPCGGVLKPGVVFFGEAVPAERTALAIQCVEQADALLVVGSSLMVFSGYRFVRRASERGLPLAAVNLGRTRADDLLDFKVSAPCGGVLQAVQRRCLR